MAVSESMGVNLVDGVRRARVTLVLLGLVELLLLVGFGWLDGVPFPLPRLLWPLAAFACYGLAARQSAGSTTRRDLALIWGVAILMRVAFLPLAPELSDDVYRYLWDGHVQLAGVSPYLFAPGDEALAPLRTSWHGLINHPDVPTIYPPLTQAVFLLVALLGETVLAAKLVWLAFDLGAAALLARAARSSDRPVAQVLVLYLWSPLLIVESAWSGHFDALGLFWLSALLLACRTRRATAGPTGALLAAAALTKFAPAAALPPLVRRHGWWSAGIFAGLCVALYLPYATVGLGPLTQGLRTYAEHWTANEGAFWIIRELVSDPIQARGVSASFVLATVAFVTWRGFSVERALLWILGAGLLMSPTVHPWYVLWILPMAALRRTTALLLLSGLVFFGYWGLGAYQTYGVWPQPGWVRALIWLPVWGMVILQAVAKLKGRRPSAPAPQP